MILLYYQAFFFQRFDEAEQLKNKLSFDHLKRLFVFTSQNSRGILNFRAYTDTGTSEYLQLQLYAITDPKYIAFTYGNNGTETELFRVNAS